VGLLSLSTADYSQIEPLVKCLAPQLSDRRVSISLPSLRAEAFSVGLADAVSEVRKSGFTFAPETGSDRLRRVINKTFTNDDMIQAADVAFARGWDLIKVYTMIGLPTEESAEPRRAREARRRHPRAGKEARPQERQRRRRLLRAQVVDALPVGALRRRRHPRAQALVPEGEVPQRARREDEVARAQGSGDRVRALPRRPARRPDPAHRMEVRRALRRLDRGNFRYDLWTKAFETEGIPKQTYLRAYDLDEILPWDVLDVSIKKRWLQIELIKAKKEMRTEDCKWGHCYACGVPGNGEDTMLAKAMPGESLPAFDAATAPASDPAAYRDVAKGAAYRQKCDAGAPVRGQTRHAGRQSLPPPHRVRQGRRRALPVPPQHDGRSSSARSAPRACRRATRRGSTRT